MILGSCRRAGDSDGNGEDGNGTKAVKLTGLAVRVAEFKVTSGFSGSSGMFLPWHGPISSRASPPYEYFRYIQQHLCLCHTRSSCVSIFE